MISILFKKPSKHFYILLLLLGAFVFNFGYKDGWKDSQMPGDEASYVEDADNYWNSGKNTNSLIWSPGYVQLMSPFIGLLGKGTGYKVWRFVLFAGISFLVYAAFMQMFSSNWIAAVLALHAQIFWVPYFSPTLQSVLVLVYLICFLLATAKPRYLGIALGLLLNAIFVSGTASFVLFSFGVSCLVFYPRHIFNRRFFIQFLACAAVLAVNIHVLEGNFTRYPERAADRGRAGLYHQISLYIWESGRSDPYLKPGEDDPKNGVDGFHRHLKAIDRYYLDIFGAIEGELRARRHDESWPLFLLDWPWLMKKDPKLMTEYRQRIVDTLKDSAEHAFQIIIPAGEDFDPNTLSARRGVHFLPLMLILVFPYLIQLARKRTIMIWPLGLTWPSGLQLLFALSCLAALLPLMLVLPHLIYSPPFIPVYLMVVALLSAAIIQGLERYVFGNRSIAGLQSEVTRTRDE